MKQTTLDLNGPILGFSTHPQDVTVNNAGIATFIGIASAYFISQTPANPASNTGIVTHRWYAAGIGALSDGTNTTLGATLSGTATTTLTVSSVTSPTTSGIQFFVGADYIPSAYQSSSPITAGTGRSTGNAINDILFSNSATLTVNPSVLISGQPSNSTVAQGQTATFSVVSSSSNNTDVAYQWYIGGSPVSNGTSGGNTISGANTNTLTVTTSSGTPAATSNVYVSVSHPTAGNSPVTSNTVTFDVVLARAILNFESLSVSSSTAILSNVNLATTSAFTYNVAIFGNPILGFYAPEKDVNLELEIFASKGLDSGGGAPPDTNLYYRLDSSQNVSFYVTEDSGYFLYLNIQGVKNFPENNSPNPETIFVNAGTYLVTANSNERGSAAVRVDPTNSQRVQANDGGGSWDDIEVLASAGVFQLGSSGGSGRYSGGQGGYSKIRFTARQNEEYIISPLPQQNQGGAVFIYRKAGLIAVVGCGGNAGSGGNGGNGGGINVGGASGSGRGAGAGGAVFSAGSLPTNSGVFGSNTANNQLPYSGTGDTKESAPNGGRVLPCARGGYWRDLGYSACQDLGNIQFFTDTGVRVTNTATINRGHKIGYGIRQTAGRGLNGGGNGGQGATGGQGGSNGGGGGGASGYTDGSVTVVSTQQGGSTGIAQVIFRTF